MTVVYVRSPSRREVEDIPMSKATASAVPAVTPSSPAVQPSAPSKSSKKKKAQETATRLKVIVRRLPPNLPEPIFWKTVEPWVSDDATTWKAYYPGKIKPKLERENVPSRAYIMFKTPEQVAQFSAGYNGHMFRDKQGHEFQAVVEFAPYQKAPVASVKPDARQGTIDQDPDFLSFMDMLNAPAEYESLTSLEKGAAQTPEKLPTVSPLIEALIQQKKSSKSSKAAKAAAQAPSVASRQAAAVASQQAALHAAQEDKEVYSRRLPGEPGPSNDPPKSKKNKGNAEAQVSDDAPGRKRPLLGATRQFEAALGAAVNPGGQPRKDRTASGPAPGSTSNQPAAPATQPASGKSKKGKGKGGGGGQAAQPGAGGPPQAQPAPPPRAEPGSGGRGRGRGRGGGAPPQVQPGPMPGMIQIATRPQAQASNPPISRIDMAQPSQPLYSSSNPSESSGGDGRPVRNAVAQQMMERLRTGGARGRGRGAPGGRGGAPAS